jgi:CRISPR-associated endonuclease Csn1
MARTLGLDLGPNSVGWALIDHDTGRIVAAGSRVFPEGVDNFDTKKEKSRNKDRRIARGMRRQVRRRAERKRRLRAALTRAGLLPRDPDELADLMAVDPYPLRARAVDPEAEPLTPHEVGRCLLHLNQRRGFLSNARKDRGDKEVKGMLAEINELAADMGDRTLGQHLAAKLDADPLDRVRGQHTRRSMLIDEFQRLWDTQARHHPDLLTDQLRYGKKSGPEDFPKRPEIGDAGRDWLEQFGLYGILFFQRKIYWPKSMVGLCELEPKEKRCPRADRLAQRFRLFQEVNNLRFVDPDTHVERGLNDEERSLLLDKLGDKAEMTFDQIRKAMGFLDSVRFNLEKGKRPKLWGLPVDHAMRHKGAFGKAWDSLDEERKNDIVRRLIDNDRDDDAIADWLSNAFGLSDEQADKAIDQAESFPVGYLNLSQVALEKLLPHMERGLVYEHREPERSARAQAGYDEPWALRNRIFDNLPRPEDARDAKLGDIPNPVVKRTLTELRKVVNAIIREHGKPDAIHVEMAREVRQGERARRETNQRMRDREAERERIKTKLRELDQPYGSRGVNILKYELWEQQSRDCIYSGKPISVAQLFSSDVEIDHVLPYSRCLDDSQMNKVICFRAMNAEKGDRWPHQWLADADPARYDSMCQRARKLPYRKYQRFTQKELDLDHFIARQLVDTGYIARATGEYLRCLAAPDSTPDDPKTIDVLGLKGQLTAELRHQWGLNGVLQHDDSDLKNRDDHRHHAVDAIVIALTNRSRLQQLSRIRKQGGTLVTGEVLSEPWDGFRHDAELVVNNIHVSHRVQRKVSGALHEDTFYGPTHDAGGQVEGVFVVRKPVEALSPNEVDKIRDQGVRNVVLARLAEHGIEVGRSKKVPRDRWMKALADPDNPLRVPTKKGKPPGPVIKKVRTLRQELTIQAIRRGKPDEAWVKPGNTHHVCIFEWDRPNGKKKRDAVWVTMLEAVQRVKEGKAIIQRTPPKTHASIPKHARFVMSLSRGELVLARLRDGSEALLVYKTSASTQGQLYFARHADARKSGEQEKIAFKANTLEARKVTVDPLGRIRWAND